MVMEVQRLVAISPRPSENEVHNWTEKKCRMKKMKLGSDGARMVSKNLRRS